MSLEIARIKMDMLKSEAAVAELEYKIAQRHEEIQRMKDHIELQNKRLGELKIELNAAQGA